MRKLLILCILSFITFSCNSYKYGASNESVQDSNLTFGVVKSKVIKGTTNQEEVLQLFGSPNIITKNKGNDEVWSYNKMSVVSKGGQTSFINGSKGSSSTSTSSFDLIITFNSDDIVKDYSVISAKF
jgi:formylmethanofuran dehydrogenase subunit A